MRRKFFIALLTALGLVIISIVAVVVYLRSGRLDIFIHDQIVQALAERGIIAEIDTTHLDLRGYRVTLEGIRLLLEKDRRLLASADRLTTDFSVTDYLRQRISITSVELTNPHVFIEYDANGVSNLDQLKTPEERETGREDNVNFASATLDINGAKLSFNDQKRNLAAEVSEFKVALTPAARIGVGRFNHDLNLEILNAGGVFEGRTIKSIVASLKAHVQEDGKRAYSIKDIAFNAGTDLGTLNVTGQVTKAEALKYSGDLQASVQLNQISRILTPVTGMNGSGALTGHVEGTNADYQFNGEAASTGFTMSDVRVSGFHAKTSLNGSGETYKATTDIRSESAGAKDANAEKIQLSAVLKGTGVNFDASGKLALASAGSDKIQVHEVSARVEATRDRAILSDIKASILGGAMTGSTTIAYGGGASKVDLAFNAIDLGQAADAASTKDVSVSGNANGTVQLSFPGLRFEQAAGRIESAFDASIAPLKDGAERSPVNGQLSLVAAGRGFTIENAVVHSPKSEATATGSIGTDGALSLDVNFKSDDMSEVQRALDAFGLVPAEINDQYEFVVNESGEFTGRVSGKPDAIQVSGRLQLDNLEAHREKIGSFEGEITYAPALLRIDNGKLSRPDGSHAEFTLNAPLKAENEISVQANISEFDLTALTKIAQPGFEDFVGRGFLTGKIDLSGLPGPRTLKGSADITLKAAEFVVPSTDSTDDETVTKRFSVPEFTGQVTIADSVLNAPNVRLQLGDSDISGKFTLNLDTYAYSVDAKGNNVDLGQVDLSDNLKLGGTANVTITSEGEWDNWSNVKVDAAIRGKDVVINGRQFGDASLVASTQGGILKVDATGKVLEEMRTISGTVDLRDKDAYPVNARIDFTDSELGPYLEFISPKLADVQGKATGSIILSGPLKDTDKIQAVARITKLDFGGSLAEGRNYRLKNEGDIVINASPKAVTVEPVTFTGDGTSIAIAGTLSLTDAAASSLTLDGELNLRLLSSFTQVLYTTGVAKVKSSIVGTLDSPRLSGTAELADAGVRILNFPISIAHGNGTIRFTEDQALVENFKAAAPGGGTISIVGGAALSGLAPDRWRIEAAAEQVNIEYPRDTQTLFDGNFVFQGNRKFQILSGDVRVRRAAYTKDLTLADLITTGGPFGKDFVETGPGGGGGGGGAATLSIDMRISADDTLIVRNNLADAAGGVFLNLRGPLSDPIATGRVMLTHGTIQFRNDRYEIDRALITFPPNRGAEPVFDVQAEADISGYHVTINFDGASSKLHTRLRSDPELPVNDLVALVLTGRPSGDTSTAAAAAQTGLGLAQTLLSATLSEQIERQTQRLFGLNRFSIDPLLVGRGSDPSARVTIGQRVTKDFTITYSQNLTSGINGLDRVVLVEYRLSNKLSIIGVRDERDIGFDIRLRKRF
ncbi:MAG: hypothetical protein DMF61_02835 [Blastocatellia bacterium AA13]|nr:MAG: hypothetical protein DMF61_02835 [Blastocatellia bacterium AA13]